MFFIWYDKNRHFKKRGNLSGQIAPFLLVSLVILLVAATATINIGKVGVDKTCADNMADAGSLAAASIWDAYFNTYLVPMNVYMFDLYCYYFWYEIEPNVTLAKEELDNAAQSLQNAIDYTAQAEAMILIGQVAIEVFIGGCWAVWVHFGGAAYLYYLAQAEMNDAERALTLAWIAAQQLEASTNEFKLMQFQNYCDVRTEMMKVYADAEEYGLMYALANGCAASKQASYGPMPSFAYYDIAHTQRNYPDELDISMASLATGMLDQAFSMLPSSIQSWGIPGKIGSALGGLFPNPLIEDDYFGIQTLETLITGAKIFAIGLGVDVGLGAAIVVDTGIMFGLTFVCDLCPVPPFVGCWACPVVAAMCVAAWIAAVIVFVDTLALLVGELTMKYVVTDILQPQMDQVIFAWDMTSPPGVFSSYDCNDVKTAGEPITGKGIPIDGLIIVDIYDVILSGWTLTCNASQEGVSSWSTAQFDGGNVAEGGYYPRIVATD